MPSSWTIRSIRPLPNFIESAPLLPSCKLGVPGEKQPVCQPGILISENLEISVDGIWKLHEFLTCRERGYHQPLLSPPRVLASMKPLKRFNFSLANQLLNYSRTKVTNNTVLSMCLNAWWWNHCVNISLGLFHLRTIYRYDRQIGNRLFTFRYT